MYTYTLCHTHKKKNTQFYLYILKCTCADIKDMACVHTIYSSHRSKHSEFQMHTQTPQTLHACTLFIHHTEANTVSFQYTHTHPHTHSSHTHTHTHTHTS